jgi:hypothetical protein
MLLILRHKVERSIFVSDVHHSADGMPGIAYRGGGYKYCKDDIGPQHEWYLADNVTTAHEEFLGTKYLENKFKNLSAGNSSSSLVNSNGAVEIHSDDEF